MDTEPSLFTDREVGLVGRVVTNEVSMVIGGDAGQGVESSGAGFCQTMARGGLHVFGM